MQKTVAQYSVIKKIYSTRYKIYLNLKTAFASFSRKEFAPLCLKGAMLSSFTALYFVSTSIAALLSTSVLNSFTGHQIDASETFTLLTALQAIKVSVLDHFNESMRILAESKITLEKIENVLGHVTPYFAVEKQERKNRKLTKKPPHSFGSKNEAHSTSQLQQVCKQERDISPSPTVFKTSRTADSQSSQEDYSSLEITDDSPRVTINALSCSWSKGSGPNTLENISLDATNGELVVITGPRGAGKTSLLMAIMNELPLIEGSIQMAGSIAFIPQKPWMTSGSLRENILLDHPFREQKYHTILRACALRKEFLTFPKGDMTLVGQNGIILNDSIRARVSLARAMYSDADIYLIDDLLSAVDATIGEHIYRVGVCGMLGDRLRFLVTRQMQYLQAANRVLALRCGSVVYNGSYRDLVSNEDFASILKLDEGEKKTIGDQVVEKAVKTRQPIPSANACIRGFAESLIEEEELQARTPVTWQMLWISFSAGMSSTFICVLVLLLISTQGNV